MRQAILKPKIPASAFESIVITTRQNNLRTEKPLEANKAGSSKPLQPDTVLDDEWDDGGLDDHDLIHVDPENDDFMDIDEFDNEILTNKASIQVKKKAMSELEGADSKLGNGNFACNHPCKDKSICKHACCKQGVKRKPQTRKSKLKDSSSVQKRKKIKSGPGSAGKTQSTLNTVVARKKSTGTGTPVEHIDLSHASKKQKRKPSLAASKLAHLHGNTTQTNEIPLLHTKPKDTANLHTDQGHDFDEISTREDHMDEDDMLLMGTRTMMPRESEDDLTNEIDYLDDDEDMLDAALVGMEDSEELRNTRTEMDMPLTREGQNMTKSSSKAEGDEELEESRLFVALQGSQDKHIVESMARSDDDNKGTPTTEGNVEGTTPSYHFECSQDDMSEEPGEWYNEKAQYGSEGAHSKGLEEEELRAWVAAELGDSVEMV